MKARVSRRIRRLAGLTVLVVAFGVAPLLLLLPPPRPTDSIHVFYAASFWPDIPAGAAPLHQMTRIGLLLPAVAAETVFGYGQAAYYATAALLMSLFAVGCFLCGRVLFGDLVGLAAAVLLLVHPIVVVDAMGGILPDAPAAGLFALGVAALVIAGRRPGRAQTGFLLAAGLFFGVAFLCREFVAFMYVAVPAFLVLLGIPLRRVLVVAGSVAGVVGFSLLHNAVVFHDAFAMLHASEDVAARSAPGVSRHVALGRFFAAMLDREPLGALLLAGLALTVGGWIGTRDRRLALLLVWFLALWIPLTLAGGVLNPRDPAFDWGFLPRYWMPVFPPVVIGGFGATVLAARRVRAGAPRAAAAVALAGVLVAAYLVPAAHKAESHGDRRDAAWNELRGWLAGRRDITLLWTDSYSAQTLEFYTRSPLGTSLWRGRIATFRHDPHHVPARVGAGPLLQACSGAAERPSEATGWRRLWRSSDRTTLSVWVRDRARRPARLVVRDDGD